MFIPWLFFKNKLKGFLIFIISVGTFLFSSFNFKQWESIWCIIATIVPFVFLILNISK